MIGVEIFSRRFQLKASAQPETKQNRINRWMDRLTEIYNPRSPMVIFYCHVDLQLEESAL